MLERKGATAPIMANRIRALLRKIFNWAITADIVEGNPVYLVPAPGKERQRDRALTADEIKCIWDAIDSDRNDADDSHKKVKTLSAGIMKLRLLTARRGAEVMSMEWNELDVENGWWTIPAEKTKNGSHRFPLTAPALAIIREMKSAVENDNYSRFVFPNPKGDMHIRNPQKRWSESRRPRKSILLAMICGAPPPEFVGKMQFYLTALDRQVRQEDENPSIGIILCKEKDRTIVEYALHDVKKPIGVATYRIVRRLPTELKGKLLSPEEISQLLKGIG